MVKRHAAGALDELVTEAALSRARLRGNQDDFRSTRLRLAQSPLEQSELALTADEAREAARPGTLEAAPNLARTPQLEHAHGNACALETLFATVEEVEEARREARGVLGHSDAAWWRQLLHPGGEPDDVPLRGVVHAGRRRFAPRRPRRSSGPSAPRTRARSRAARLRRARRARAPDPGRPHRRAGRGPRGRSGRRRAP